MWEKFPKLPESSPYYHPGILVATPYRTATALAVAGHLPILEPIAVPAPLFTVAGIAAEQAPLTGNVQDAAGDKTAGFMQWTNSPPGAVASHFVVFYRPEANKLIGFLDWNLVQMIMSLNHLICAS